MKRPQALLCVALLAVGSAGEALADRFLQLSLWAPKPQLVSESESIAGVRLQVYGRNDHVSGIDFGIAHATQGDFKGWGLGIVNLVKGNAYGLQESFLGYGRVGGNLYGQQSALFGHVQGDAFGLQNSLVGLTEKDFYGLQGSLIFNRTGNKVSGMQAGIVNMADSVTGAQVGLVNFTREMAGLQIGLWNQISSKEKLRVFPIVNWKF